MNRFVAAISLLFVAAGVYAGTVKDRSMWWATAFFGACFLISVVRLLPKRWFANMSQDSFLRRLRSDAQIPDPRLGVLKADETHLTHSLPDGTTRVIAWSDVTRITTYKLDLLATDCICLLFEGCFPESPYEIHEEMVGFADLFGFMRTAFPAVPGNWFLDVATPAFATNLTVLFERGAGTR